MIKSTAQPVRAQSNESRNKTTKETKDTKTKTTKSKTDVVLETKGDEVHLSFDGQRRYRIRGLERNHSSQQLKVNILAARDGVPATRRWFIWIRSIYSRRAVGTSFIKATATELFTDSDIIKRDIGTMLLQLEQLQHERIEAATQARNQSNSVQAKNSPP